MNIVKRLDQYDDTCLFFCEPTKNNVMNDGNFIRILYSTPEMTLNGIYFIITLHDIVCEKYYTKYKCSFNVTTHTELIQQLQNIEESILYKYSVENKEPQYKIYEQLRNGHIKLFGDIGNKPSAQFMLKISGIWETEDKYGLTYKFITVNS